MSKLSVTIDGHTFEVSLNVPPNGHKPFTVTVNGETFGVLVPEMELPSHQPEWMIINGRPYELVFDNDLRWLKSYFGIHQVEVRDMEALAARPRSGDGRIKAPIPGLITRLLVEVGDKVEIGRPLLVLEAMKMENEIRAARSGTVAALHVSPGQGVVRGEVLAEIV